MVIQASDGKNNIKEGSVGHAGYGFLFRDINLNLPYLEEYGTSKLCAIGSMRDVAKKFKKLIKSNKKFGLFDLLKKQEECDVILAGSLKTLIPELKFGGDEILYDAWMFVKTPNDKFFPVTVYYGASGPSLGGWYKTNHLNKETKFTRLTSAINFSPFSLNNKELNLFLDAFEYALKKVPTSDFEGIFEHDDGMTKMGIKRGKPYIEEIL